MVTCAGQDITLVPATPYSIERLTHLYGSGETGFNNSRNYTFRPDPPEYSNLSRKTVCNSQGNFTFDKIADGEYFIVLSVNWVAGGLYQGGNLMKRIRLNDGSEQSVIISY